MKPSLYILTFLFSLLSIGSLAQEIECDGSAFLTTLSASGSSLYRLQINQAQGVQSLEPIITDNIEYQLGCIGYSVVDKMIYALDYNNYKLLRINALGEITDLDKPIGLDTDLRYQAGEVFPDGTAFFVAGRDEASQLDKAYFAINLVTLEAVPVEFESSINSTIQDIAINPRDGAFFGYDSRSNKIVNVDFGVVSNYQFPVLPEIFTSLFFDQSFNLYAYGDKSLGINQKFYSINKVTSEVTYLQDGPLAIDSDACGCAYQFDFFKKVSPQEAIPCQEVTIEYSFQNSSGAPRTGLSLVDTLPEVLTITDIDLGNPNNIFDAVINSGVGTNILDLSNLFILVADVHTIKVTAEVARDVNGEFYFQGVLNNLPLALNPRMVSDDLNTLNKDDANFFKVIDPANPNFKDSIAYNCDNTVATILAPIPAANSFLWSDGTTEKSIQVTEAGFYNVIMETDCENYAVDIAVDFNQPTNFIDFGEDLLIPIGQTITLPFESNLTNPTNYAWQANNASIFSCNNCPTPSIRVTEPTTISLTLTDIEGCQVSAEISIEVIETKNVYAPTAFSPNRDGINDIFFLQGTDALIRSLQIFDRWGNLIFDRQNVAINDSSAGWEGDFQGKAMELGVYIWSAQMEYLDGTEEMLSGTVSVFR